MNLRVAIGKCSQLLGGYVADIAWEVERHFGGLGYPAQPGSSAASSSSLGGCQLLLSRVLVVDDLPWIFAYLHHD